MNTRATRVVRGTPFWSAALFTVLVAVLFAPAARAGQTLVPVVSVTATQPETREPSCQLCAVVPPPPGVLEFSRTGGDLTQALYVFIQTGGSAINGDDYEAMPNSVVFPSGESRVLVYLQPRYDQIVEGDETVSVAIQPDPSLGPIERYRVDPALSSAKLVIHDATPAGVPPVVHIEATQRIAEESSYPLKRMALRGEFAVVRTGPATAPLSVFVRYSGTATPDADFPALPFLVTIPAGSSSVALEVVPVADALSEGIETLEATLSQCPPDTDPPMGIPCYGGYDIDPLRDRATVFLRDDGITQSSVVITSPTKGQSFAEGGVIRIQATAIDLGGAITHLEFYDGDKLLGDSNVLFVRAPDPGTPIFHEFDWKGASVGTHGITARGMDSSGGKAISQPVEIEVIAPTGIQIVTVTTRDAFGVEPATGGELDVAAFSIRRSGSTNADLTVGLSLHGTAVNGVDYEKITEFVTVPKGRRSVLVTITPIQDRLLEPRETVVLKLEVPATDQYPPPYAIGSPARAIAVISDKPWAHGKAQGECVILPEGFAHVCFVADPLLAYRVEASADFLSWEPIFHGVPVGDALHAVDDQASGIPHRFYRLVEEPAIPEL